MAPRIQTNNIINEIPDLEPDYEYSKESEVQEKAPFKVQIVWKNVFLMGLLHAFAIYGIYLSFTSAMWQTLVTAFMLYVVSGMGITVGAHRLWAHRSYKARFPLRLFLGFLQTMAGQNDIYEWSRDHRVHHKYSETDADPHNAKRGFFFAHVGWLLCRKHPEVIQKGRTISYDDLLHDPIVYYQKKHYKLLLLLCCFVIPTLIPVLLFGDTAWNGFFICACFRYIWTLHMTWLVNSAAHFWGRHPYDDQIHPAENYFTVYGAIGEGFHNYHHVFPWDYSASELGWRFNISTMFINLMALIGQAYDLKRVTPEMIVKRKLRTGDVLKYGNYGLWNPTKKQIENHLASNDVNDQKEH